MSDMSVAGGSRSKVCVICGSVFHRRSDESQAVFGERKTCGWYCASYLQSLQRASASKPFRYCLACGARIPGGVNGVAVLTCSDRCRDAYLAGQRVCRWCGRIYDRPPDVPPPAFRKFRFCGDECKTLFMENAEFAREAEARGERPADARRADGADDRLRAAMAKFLEVMLG